MKILSSHDEILLLAILKLGDNAYGLPIYQHILKLTGKKFAIGGIYYPLERLVKRRYLDAFKGEPSSVRGGQSKRYYRLTQHGHDVLVNSRKTQDSFWQGLPDLSFSTRKSNE